MIQIKEINAVERLIFQNEEKHTQRSKTCRDDKDKNGRLVSSVGKAPVRRAGGRGFKPMPDEPSGSLNN